MQARHIGGILTDSVFQECTHLMPSGWIKILVFTVCLVLSEFYKHGRSSLAYECLYRTLPK